MHFCWEYVCFLLLNVMVTDSPEPSVLFDGNLRQFNGYLSTKLRGEDRIFIAFPRKINSGMESLVDNCVPDRPPKNWQFGSLTSQFQKFPPGWEETEWNRRDGGL